MPLFATKNSVRPLQSRTQCCQTSLDFIFVHAFNLLVSTRNFLMIHSLRRSLFIFLMFVGSNVLLLPGRCLAWTQRIGSGRFSRFHHLDPRQKVSLLHGEAIDDTANGSIVAATLATRIKTVDALKSNGLNALVTIKGWVRTVRKQKTLAFVEVNDGSCLSGIQCVIPLTHTSSNHSDTMHAIDQLSTGAAVEFVGKLLQSEGKNQAVELSVESLRVVGTCPADSYPLAKKRHSLEYLRSIAHLRPRTNTISAVARVRSVLAGSIHAFFQHHGFVYVQTPLITASDCEGAGELFRVTTLPADKPFAIPVLNGEKSNQPSDSTDFSQDFFGKPAFLTVSGQLAAETHACALGDVYTFGPTFRAENSQTTRHLAEFHMLEPEMAFADLQSAMNNAEQMLKFVVEQVLARCNEDLTFFQQFYDKGLKDRLETLVAKPFIRISYREAIQHLRDEISKDESKWQFPHVEFGTDLATEHERWLAETKFRSAVFVYNYPKQIKAFYMRDNDDDNGETVNAMDLLVPGVGELIGGSQREERYDVLIQKMKDFQLNPDDYWWYLDLRRFGTVPHAGYGLGFERLVTYVCGLDNIRDAIAFPRYPGSAEF
jgi:asparaginyl-tRNA synthetase